MAVFARRRLAEPAAINPNRSLWLVTIAHAFNHAQAALLPLIYLRIIEDFSVTPADIAYLVTVGNVMSGSVQLTFSWLTRHFSRRGLLGWGNVFFGVFMALQGLATSFIGFGAANILSRVGAAQQHPVGNGLLAEQFPPHRRGFAISVHIAGGNLGTVAIPLVGLWLILGVGWQLTVVLFGIPPVLIGIAMLAWIQEIGTDRAAALAHGSLRDAFRTIIRDRDLLLTYLSSVLGGGARGLGVLNIFVPFYLKYTLGYDDERIALMLTVLLIGSVPGPIISGWLSDRIGRRALIVGVYLGGAGSLAAFVLAGSDPLLVWLGVILLSVFNFVESPQLQALLADISRPSIRDASFSVYFTLAFGVGSLWTAVYGTMIHKGSEATDLPAVFWLMALAFLAAAVSVLPIHAEQRTAEVREEERRIAAEVGSPLQLD
jgi:FSR family fosmidomycin resistance protein-like MFS transporter